MESIGVIGISDSVTDFTEIEMAREATLSFEQVENEFGEVKLRVTAPNFKPTQDIHCSFLFIE